MSGSGVGEGQSWISGPDNFWGARDCAACYDGGWKGGVAIKREGLKSAPFYHTLMGTPGGLWVGGRGKSPMGKNYALGCQEDERWTPKDTRGGPGSPPPPHRCPTPPFSSGPQALS